MNVLERELEIKEREAAIVKYNAIIWKEEKEFEIYEALLDVLVKSKHDREAQLEQSFSTIKQRLNKVSRYSKLKNTYYKKAMNAFKGRDSESAFSYLNSAIGYCRNRCQNSIEEIDLYKKKIYKKEIEIEEIRRQH